MWLGVYEVPGIHVTNVYKGAKPICIMSDEPTWKFRIAVSREPAMNCVT